MAKGFPNVGATVIDSSSDLPAASAALEGVMMFQKDTNELKICDGTNWISTSGTDNPLLAVRFNTWTPTNLTGTSTYASAVTAITGTSTAYHSYAFASNVLTITHKIPGTYRMTLYMAQRHAAAYTTCRVLCSMGGTSTKSWDTGNTTMFSDYGDDASDADTDTSVVFTVTATANQTTTFSPYYEATGGGSTNQHKALANVYSEFINSNTGV